MNLRLRIHLALIVPQHGSTGNNTSNSSSDNNNDNSNDSDDSTVTLGIQVGTQIREWIPNKALVLDDSFQHEVWNYTNASRVVLLVDIWHPDISMEERKAIVQLFQQAKQDGLWKR
jgi:Aspartyl/Asparaginyl beta-hydroxylase